jgi:N-methylhydantoinase A/oxoprolinase/acetone carboxylase beta subunit
MIIGLDVGGTYADAVLLGPEGLINFVKVSTDPSDLFATVLTGLEKVTRGIDPLQIQRLVLSTTLSTNAIVQKQMPPVGMIVSSGPGVDARLYRTNDHYCVVGGSIDHRGREIEPVNAGEIRKIAETFKKEGLERVGVVGKFSVRNPSHELKIADILGDRFEKVFLGHRVSGNLNFPRRIATAFLNAAVYPIHKNFFEAVKKSLEKKGLNVPIHILKADGGTMRFESSMDFPGQTILSGPAASVMGAIAFASPETESLVLDIGGTTTDMAVLLNQIPLLNPLGITLDCHKTLIRSLETHSIGLGGDSAVRVKDGRIVIGPDRMGPAMAYGGSTPTPTDALFVLGKTSNGDREKAVQGIESVAGAIGMDLEQTARWIFDAACTQILSEAREMIRRINSKPVYTVRELWEGTCVKPTEMLILGGPAQYFAEHFREISDYQVRVVPHWGVANAVGAALARTTCEVALLVDTEQGIATAPEEGISERVGRNFSRDDALKKAFELLRKKALEKGADPEELEMEVIEDLQFNMVQGFYTTGKNIRVKVQVQPGLIRGFSHGVKHAASQA